VSATLDTVDNRRLVVDVGGPVIPGDLGVLISYAGEDSGSYFYGHYMRKNAIYAAVRWRPNDKYQLDFNTELNVEQYTEEVGVNRASQNLIDHGLYLQGTPVGELDSTVFGAGVGGAAILHGRADLDRGQLDRLREDQSQGDARPDAWNLDPRSSL
jgi:hypothetical protein